MIHLVVKRELKNLDKTQQWLSDQTGISQPNINAFLNGKRKFMSNNLDKIAVAFNKEWNLTGKKNKPGGLSDLINDN